MNLTGLRSFAVPVAKQEINFGYASVMKKVATREHVHCAYGGEELNENNPATAEHVHPHSQGGEDTDDNFLPVCEKHNQLRGCKSYPKFFRRYPKTLDNIKTAILELNKIITPEFNGHEWAKKIVKAVEKQAKQTLNLELGEDIVLEPVKAKEIPQVDEDGYSNDEYDLSKTLTTVSGQKIHIKRKKSLNLVA